LQTYYNYKEISKKYHETKDVMYITKNGTKDLVVLSDETYQELIKTNKETDEERIDRLVAMHFENHYESFENT